jgi:hypothetical protein
MAEFIALNIPTMNPGITKKLLFISLSAFAISTQSPAEDRPSAKTQTPFIDQQEKKVRQQIDEGIKSGELTPSETKILENQLKQIERMEEQARKTGVILEQTRKNLRSALAKLEDDTYRLTHNAQKVASSKPSASTSPAAQN